MREYKLWFDESCGVDDLLRWLDVSVFPHEHQGRPAGSDDGSSTAPWYTNKKLWTNDPDFTTIIWIKCIFHLKLEKFSIFNRNIYYLFTIQNFSQCYIKIYWLDLHELSRLLPEYVCLSRFSAKNYRSIEIHSQKRL